MCLPANSHMLHLNCCNLDIIITTCSRVLRFAGTQHFSKLTVESTVTFCACTLTMPTPSPSFSFSGHSPFFDQCAAVCLLLQDQPTQSVSGDALLPLQYVGRSPEGALLDDPRAGPRARTSAWYAHGLVIG